MCEVSGRLSSAGLGPVQAGLAVRLCTGHKELLALAAQQQQSRQQLQLRRGAGAQAARVDRQRPMPSG